MKESHALDIICKYIKNEYKISNLGYISRYIWEKHGDNKCFYMLGSMGHALSIGIGVAMTLEGKRKVYVIDGDGSLLMNLGATTTYSRYVQKGLIHILIDNKCHNSTGGQKTNSTYVDISKIYESFGNIRVYNVGNETELVNAMREVTISSQNDNAFVKVNVDPLDIIPSRVGISTEEIKNNFVQSLKSVKN